MLYQKQTLSRKKKAFCQNIAQLINLSLLHRDPFDRLIISQALQHELTMMTEDKAMLTYPRINFV